MVGVQLMPLRTTGTLASLAMAQARFMASSSRSSGRDSRWPEGKRVQCQAAVALFLGIKLRFALQNGGFNEVIQSLRSSGRDIRWPEEKRVQCQTVVWQASTILRDQAAFWITKWWD